MSTLHLAKLGVSDSTFLQHHSSNEFNLFNNLTCNCTMYAYGQRRDMQVWRHRQFLVMFYPQVSYLYPQEQQIEVQNSVYIISVTGQSKMFEKNVSHIPSFFCHHSSINLVCACLFGHPSKIWRHLSTSYFWIHSLLCLFVLPACIAYSFERTIQKYLGRDKNPIYQCVSVRIQ